MNVRAGETPVFIGDPQPLEDHVEKIVVDGGAVHIDAHDPDQVIRIKHTRGDGVDVLAAKDIATGTNTIRLDSAGDLHFKAGGATVSLAALKGTVDTQATSITALQGTLAAATAVDDGATDTVVKRSQANGTQICNLHVVADDTNYNQSFPPAGLYFEKATGRGEITLVEDARVRFQPYDVDDSVIEERTFAFGRAVPLTGETDVTADSRRRPLAGGLVPRPVCRNYGESPVPHPASYWNKAGCIGRTHLPRD